jgi:hypothetical protein
VLEIRVKYRKCLNASDPVAQISHYKTHYNRKIIKDAQYMSAKANKNNIAILCHALNSQRLVPRSIPSQNEWMRLWNVM